MVTNLTNITPTAHIPTNHPHMIITNLTNITPTAHIPTNHPHMIIIRDHMIIT
jgi:hypothetical protein